MLLRPDIVKIMNKDDPAEQQNEEQLTPLERAKRKRMSMRGEFKNVPTTPDMAASRNKGSLFAKKNNSANFGQETHDDVLRRREMQLQRQQERAKKLQEQVQEEK